jgi:hypothetical protein
METYDLFYKGVKLNNKPLTAEEADYEIGLIIINYGYRPEKIKN